MANPQQINMPDEQSPVETQEDTQEEDSMISGLKAILASNDIDEIHQIAQQLISKNEAEDVSEQQPAGPKQSFVDKMVAMHKLAQAGNGQAGGQNG